MQIFVQRYVLAGLALLPAWVAFLLPDPARHDIFSAFGTTGTLALWSVLALGVIHAASRPQAPAVAPPDPPTLLRRRSLKELNDLPPTDVMRSDLAKLLALIGPDDTVPQPDHPCSGEEALARALDRTLQIWQVPTVHALGDTRLIELYVLAQLVQAPPDRAGALAQLFAHPAKVLDLRDRISALSARYDTFQRQRDAYQATLLAWTNQPPVLRPSALLTSLQGLEKPDIDLWHRVVLEHDPRDPAQREAALWCARQPQCDRATIAAYLSLLAADGHLEAAARQADTLWLKGVLSVIEAWNAGVYTRCELGLTPEDAVSQSAPILSHALDRLAELSGEPRWPEPQALFTEYRGRAPLPRDHWCLRSGAIVTAPNRAHFFEARQVEVA
ncbi:hypothetical protein ACOXXX_16545 [Thalassococcus sp. BH17M4-6]|uniref:hypothetical protein n=1 Tax=Thalassococcus sp. BH17M4-6 TaxID=3413148 RepID=UPI003BD59848